MTFDLGDALQEGLARTATRTGAILVGLFLVVQVLSGLVSQSLFRTLFLEYVDWEALFEGVQDPPIEEIRSQVDAAFAVAPLDVPVETLGGALVVLWLVQVVVRIGAIRWFVAGPSTRLTGDLFTRGLGWTVLNLIVGLVVYAIAVIVGLVLFVVPGIFLAVALFFYNYEVVVEGKNAVDALAGSYELTAGNRFGLFALGLIFAVLGTAVGWASGLGDLAGPTAGLVASSVVTSVLAVAGIAVASVAYTQLRTDAEAAGDVAVDETTA